MKSRFIKPTVTCLVAMMLGLSGSSAAQTVSVHDTGGLFRALMAGDSKLANSIVREHHANPTFVSLVDAQLAYDLPKIASLAKHCRDAAFKAHVIGTALACDQNLVGVAWVTGDAHGFFQALNWMKTTGFRAAEVKRGRQPIFGNVFDHVDLSRLAASYASPHISVRHGPASIRYAQPHKTHARPMVDVTINGHRAKAYVDTGNPLSIIMDEAHAKKLGLTLLVRGVRAPKMIYASKKASRDNASIYMAGKLRMGPLMVRNIMVLVIKNHYSASGISIGTPLLRHFSSVTFTKSTIDLNETGASCRHPTRMTFASSPTENGKLVFIANHEGTPVKASIDTGSNVLLVVGPEFQTGHGGNGVKVKFNAFSPPQTIHRTHLAVSVGGYTIEAPRAPVISGLASPIEALVGAPVLQKANVRLAFSPLSICFAARN